LLEFLRTLDQAPLPAGLFIVIRCLVRAYRKALVTQLLTPVHRAADVDWKQKTLATGQHEYTDVTAERIEFAIAQDREFLAAHPTRRKIVREDRHA
jgi:hypothetical protein